MSGVVLNRDTSIKATDNQLTLDDFRKLTTNRKGNAGTLKLVKDASGNVTGLKCAQHHSIRKLANVFESVSANDVKELHTQLKDLVKKELEAILDQKLGNLPSFNRKDKLNSLISLFDKDMSIEGADHKIVPLKRTQIEQVLLKLDQLKKMDGESMKLYGSEAINRALGNAGSFAEADVRALQARGGKPEIGFEEAYVKARNESQELVGDDDLCGKAWNRFFDKLCGSGAASVAKKQSIIKELCVNREVTVDESGRLNVEKRLQDSMLYNGMRRILNAIYEPGEHERFATLLGVEGRSETFAKECFSIFFLENLTKE